MSESGLTLDQSSLAAVLDTLGRGEDAALARLFELLGIPSVSTDRAFDADCRKAAAWCVAALQPKSGRPRGFTRLALAVGAVGGGRKSARSHGLRRDDSRGTETKHERD